MAARRFADYAASQDEPIFKLPHPYLTAYHVVASDDNDNNENDGASTSYSLQIRPHSGPETGIDPPRDLQTESSSRSSSSSRAVYFTEPQGLKSSDRPKDSNNTAWARARRSPSVALRWRGDQPPPFAQLWLVVYALVTLRPDEEAFRLRLSGAGADGLAAHLKAVSLAIDHPKPPPSSSPSSPSPSHSPSSAADVDELLVLRGAFWQGAGCPFGPRPVWAPLDVTTSTSTSTSPWPHPPVSSYPLPAQDYTLTVDPPSALCWHPRRPAKPRPGSVIYSRYVPHLREVFSMVALDLDDESHLRLFHAWQNDPRVSQGWNETGTLDQHRAYLRRCADDPHQLAVLARFDGVPFAYFETYWAKEDRLGAYYAAGDYDRGRHSLVGDVRYRGPHRVGAWWSSLVHYLFLDDPRTTCVVGEPKSANTSVLLYDLVHGFGLDKLVDLPHKRSAFVRCSRERFFQLCPLGDGPKVVGGTSLGLVPKL